MTHIIRAARGCKGSRFGGKREQSVGDQGLRSDGKTPRAEIRIAGCQLGLQHLGKESKPVHTPDRRERLTNILITRHCPIKFYYKSLGLVTTPLTIETRKYAHAPECYFVKTANLPFLSMECYED